MSRRGGDRTQARPRSGRRDRAVTVRSVVLSGIGAVALGLCFLYLLQSMALRDLTARCALAREGLVDAEEINRSLEFRIEQAFSLERVSRVARARLGMVEPTVVHYVPLPATNR